MTISNPLTMILQQDLLVNILQYSEDIGKCAAQITSQIREMIGARAVALLERRAEGHYNLSGVCPVRRQELFSNPVVQQLVEGLAQSQKPEFIEPGKGEMGALPSTLGMQASIAIPLRAQGQTETTGLFS